MADAKGPNFANRSTAKTNDRAKEWPNCDMRERGRRRAALRLSLDGRSGKRGGRSLCGYGSPLSIALPPAFGRSVCPDSGGPEEAAKSRWKQQINGGREGERGA